VGGIVGGSLENAGTRVNEILKTRSNHDYSDTRVGERKVGVMIVQECFEKRRYFITNAFQFSTTGIIGLV
jgi:hypothetical protein